MQLRRDSDSEYSESSDNKSTGAKSSVKKNTGSQRNIIGDIEPSRRKGDSGAESSVQILQAKKSEKNVFQPKASQPSYGAEEDTKSRRMNSKESGVEVVKPESRVYASASSKYFGEKQKTDEERVGLFVRFRFLERSLCAEFAEGR